jgi:PAS domain S-box-containing protein
VLQRLARLAHAIAAAPSAVILAAGPDRVEGFAGCGLPAAWDDERDALIALCAEAAASAATLLASDVHSHPFLATLPAIARLGLASFLAVPLPADRQCRGGAICLLSREPRVWTDADRAAIEDLAVLFADAWSRPSDAGVAAEQRQKTAILNAIETGVYGMDGRGRCTFINRAGLAMVGYSPDEVFGTRIHELIHHSLPDGTPYPAADCPLLKGMQQGHAVRLENEVLWRKDGSFFTADYASFPMFEDGSVNGSVVTFQDTSRRGEARQRLTVQITVSRILAGSQDRATAMEQVLAAIGSGLGLQVGSFWCLDEHDRLLRPAARWVAPGVHADDVLATAADATFACGRGLPGRVWAEAAPVHIPDISAAADLPQREAAIASGLTSAFAFPVQVGTRVLGVIGYFGRDRLTPDDDYLDNVAMLGRQIGQYLRRKSVEEALRESEERFRSLVEATSAIVWTADAKGTFAAPQESWSRFTGLPAAALQNDGWLAVIHPDDRAATVKAWARAIRSPGLYKIEHRVRRYDGEYRHMMVRAVPITQADNGVREWFGLHIDVTDRRRVEQELAAAKEAAEEANRAKSQFLANMSHELRTPLSAVIGYSEMIAEELAGMGAETMLQDMQKIEANARHLLELINSVLDISKIEAGKMELHAEDVEVAALVQQVAATVQPLIDKKGNTLVVEVADAAGRMHTDVVKLRQCLFNLLSNAAKFTEAGRITLAATPGEGEDDGCVVFRVEDTGIGMSGEQARRLFQRFMQADSSTTRRFGGTGLGLAITKAFAQMMGGDIRLATEEGVGTTFTLTLPRDLRELRAAPRIAGQPAPGGEQPAADGDVILVVDDERPMRELLTRFLEREGFAVAEAEDAPSGLALARSLHPRAILLDVMMPRIDGWSLLSSLKADAELADIPVIMVSVVREKGLARSLGASDYFTKPVNWQRLKRVLDRYRTSDVASCVALIVDDDAETRQVMRSALESDGWAVVEAADETVAFALLAQWRPSIILLDVQMSGMNGFAFIQALRANPEYRSIPIIVATGNELTPEQRERLNGNVRQIVAKDLHDAQALADELREAIASLPRPPALPTPSAAAAAPTGDAHAPTAAD